MAAEIQRQLPGGKQADCGKNAPRQQGQMISLAQIIKPAAKKTAQPAAQRFNELAYRYPTKMIALTECGTVADISAQWSADAKWSFFMPWYPGGGVVHATDAWWQSAMSNSNVITR